MILLVVDKPRYQRNAVVQRLAAQSGSSLIPERKGPAIFYHQGNGGGPFGFGMIDPMLSTLLPTIVNRMR